MRVDFHIPCAVAPKQSVRGGSIRYYQPTKLTNNAKLLASYLYPRRPMYPLCGPLRALYVVRYPFRKREPKKNRTRPIPKTAPPDFEQLAKQLGDVLESCRFFSDDAHIFHATIVKLYDVRHDVHIIIEECDGVISEIPCFQFDLLKGDGR